MELRKLLILALGIFSGVILILTTEEINWLIDEIFIITVSLVFISPLITSMFNMKYPKEYIVVFVIGGILFVVYAYLFYNTFAEVVTMLFKVILFSAISTFAVLLIKKLEDIVPP